MKGDPLASEKTQHSTANAPGPGTKQSTWIAGMVIVVITLAALMILVLLRPTAGLNSGKKFRTLQTPFTQIGYAGLSPDGNWTTYPAREGKGKWELYFMNTVVGEPHRMTSDSSADMVEAAVSPDGNQIAYRSSRMELCTVPSHGGKSKLIVPRALFFRWRPDGQRIGYIQPTQKGNEYWSVMSDGSDSRLEFIDTLGVEGDVSFSYSQQGSSIAFLRTFSELHTQEIIIHELPTGKELQITNDQKNIAELCWTPNDQIIFSSNRGGNMNLWTVSVFGGEPDRITNGRGPDLGIRISADGKKLLYYQGQEVSQLMGGKLVMIENLFK